MAQEKDLLKKFGLYGEATLKKRRPEEEVALSYMSSPSYLRQSSALINEALKTGFDVLQLANGDIVTTGTKTIVNKYIWDPVKGKLIKSKPDDKPSRGRAKKARLDAKEPQKVAEDA